jgi:signal transduction histidine kinase
VELIRRNRELSALNAIAETLSRSLDLETTLHDTLQKVLEVMEIEAGLIHLLDEEAGELIVCAHQGLSSQYVQGVDRLKLGEGFAGRVAQSGEPIVVDDISSDPRLTRMVVQEEKKRSFISVPLKARDRVLGTMNLVSQSFRQFSPQDLQLLTAIGNQIGVAVENAQLYEEIREYAQTLEQRVEERTREIQDRTHALAVAEERNRLARELHDSVTQYLFSLVLNANAAGTLLEKDQQQAREQIQVVQEIAQNALGEMRSLIFELRPAMLEERGLPYVLALYVDSIRRKEGLDVILRVDGERRLLGELEQGLYRIAQEALFNVVKHAMAKTVTVELEIRPDRVSLSVEDNGVGFDPSSPPGKGITLGLTSMRERAKLLGGEFEIQSQPGQGTRVSVRIPLEENGNGWDQRSDR